MGPIGTSETSVSNLHTQRNYSEDERIKRLIISLNSMNKLVFVIETQFVFWDAENNFFSVIKMKVKRHVRGRRQILTDFWWGNLKKRNGFEDLVEDGGKYKVVQI